MVRRPAGSSRFARESPRTRCSRTTGRSCSARSRCTASSILVLTGIVPHVLLRPEPQDRSSYHGSYAAARRRRTCRRPTSRSSSISFDVRAGLVMRQIHHWAALLFLARDRRPPLPHLLHRRVPQAARDQLDRRRDAAAPRPSPTGSPATRSPTTCSPAPASASPTRSCSRSRSSATWLAFLVFGGEFPAHDICAASSSSTCCSCRSRSSACSRSTSRSSGARSTPSSPDVSRSRRATHDFSTYDQNSTEKSYDNSLLPST